MSHACDWRNRHIKNAAEGSKRGCLIWSIINYNQSQCSAMPTIQIKSKTPYLMYWKLVFEGVLRDSIRPEPISVEGDSGMKIMIFDETCMND
jgi:hypothetical protein